MRCISISFQDLYKPSKWLRSDNKVKQSIDFYSALSWPSSPKCSDMARVSQDITQFYLSPTHEPYLPLLPSCTTSPPFGWYSLRLPTEGWLGWVDLGDWLYTETGFLHWELNTGPVTHPSSNQARHRVTSLIEANALTLCQTAKMYMAVPSTQSNVEL